MTAPTWQVEQCSTCAAPIIWAVTERARPMPIDAQPTKGGNVLLRPRGSDMQPLAVLLPVAKQFGHTNLRTSHFATCPQANQHRRRGGARVATSRKDNPDA